MATLRVPITAQDHGVGPADAPVTVVEYGDYECPYCREAVPYVQRLLDVVGDRVRFVFRNFPLQDAHPHAVDAAYVAEYAAEHGQFWPAHDLLYAHQDELGDELYEQIATKLGLSVDGLSQAFSSNRYDARIEADEEGGLRSGVNGTPTFFVNGVRVDQGTAGLDAAVAAALGES